MITMVSILCLIAGCSYSGLDRFRHLPLPIPAVSLLQRPDSLCEALPAGQPSGVGEVPGGQHLHRAVARRGLGLQEALATVHAKWVELGQRGGLFRRQGAARGVYLSIYSLLGCAQRLYVFVFRCAGHGAQVSFHPRADHRLSLRIQ